MFVDDDAFPRRDWLVQLRKAMDGQPGYSTFGGAIVPRWESAPPSWVNWVDHGVVYSLTSPTGKSGPMPAYFAFGSQHGDSYSIFEAGARFDCSIVGAWGPAIQWVAETDFLMRSAAGDKAPGTLPRQAR